VRELQLAVESVKVRIPSHGERHSDAMANIVPRAWRTAFRHDGEHDSEVMSSSVPI
jgi:hypothetical protein